VVGNSSLSTSSSQSTISTYLKNLLAADSRFASLNPTVSSWQYSASSSSYKFSVTFVGYDGDFEPIVISTNPYTSTSTVTTTVHGTSTIGGSFTLSFQGNMTVDLPFDVSAQGMKEALEDLPGIGTVSVSRAINYISGANRNAYTWLVTFESLAGDLPMMYATPGRLTPGLQCFNKSERICQGNTRCVIV